MNSDHHPGAEVDAGLGRLADTSGQMQHVARIRSGTQLCGGGPTDGEFTVIEAVALIADELATSSAAVALAWLRARPGTVVPIVGARKVEHLVDNLAALEVRLTPEHLRMLDAVSAPTLDYPAPMHGELRASLQFAGTTVDGEPSTVYPPLLASDIRY